jgi:hypothetical protein
MIEILSHSKAEDPYQAQQGKEAICPSSINFVSGAAN